MMDRVHMMEQGNPRLARFVLLVATLTAFLLGGCSASDSEDPQQDTASHDSIAGPDSLDAGGQPDVRPDAQPDVPAPLDTDGPDAADATDVAPQPDTADVTTSDACGDGCEDTADVPEPDVFVCPNECCWNEDCDDGINCTKDHCNDDGVCEHEEVVCDDGDECTDDGCDAKGECVFTPVAECCPFAPVWQAGFEDGEELAFTIKDRAQNTNPESEAWDQPIVWSVSNVRAADGLSSLYFGDPERASYENGRHVAAAAVSSVIELPVASTLELRFHVWMDAEPTAGYDALNVSVLLPQPEGEPLVVPVWTKPEGFVMNEWTAVVVDVTAFRGEEIQLQLVFDTIDESTNGFEGVYVDGLAIGTRCEVAACAAPEDCADDNPCTVDACDEGACVHTPLAGCCLNAIDCYDGVPCVIDICDEGACRHVDSPDPDCCAVDADCDDGDPCTDATCEAGRCERFASGAAGCCSSDDDCADELDCTTTSCNTGNGSCDVEWTCNCRYDIECQDPDPCVESSCRDGRCFFQPTLAGDCCDTEPFVDGFESESRTRAMWSFNNSSGSVGWTVWNGSATSSSALYYGNPGTGNYSGGRNSGTVTTNPIELPRGVDLTLSTSMYLDVESGPSHDTLRFSMYVGAEEILLWEKDFSTELLTWLDYEADLSGFAGETVFFRFAFDTEDSEGNDGEGVYVDDFHLTSSCQVRECEMDVHCDDGFGATAQECLNGICQYRMADALCDTDAQCHDGDECTYDRCVLGGCEFPRISGCCNSSADCDDRNPCSEDMCVSGNPSLCQYRPIEGCCNTEADCNDDNPCTVDSCPEGGGFCSNEWQEDCCLTNAQCSDDEPCTNDMCVANRCQNIWACCASDDECDDGDDVCTVDTCVDQRCRFAIDPSVPGCCDEETSLADFEGGASVGWEFTNTGNNTDAWRVIQSSGGVSPHGGQYMLYFGNSAGTEYDDDAEGVALSPNFTVPDDQEVELSFWVRTDTESCCDELDIYLDAEGRSWHLGEYAGVNSWREVTFDLSSLSGSTFRLRFQFESDGSVTEVGAWVDDITMQSTCAPVVCDDDGDCDTVSGCLGATCVAGGCHYQRRDDCCQTAADCDDGDGCTTDSCRDEVCSYTEIPGCCRGAEDCDDGIDCTLDSCVAGECAHMCDPECPDCCFVRSDCDDGDSCTLDECVDHACVRTWLCCDSDEECDDGDDVCTIDRCVDRRCVFEVDATVEGCCSEQPVTFDFEDGALDGWEIVQNGAGGDAWQVTDGQSHTGSRSLYYGHGDAYASNTEGMITSPEVRLPAGQQLTLAFWNRTYMEGCCDYLRVWVGVAGEFRELGDWNGDAGWARRSYDISYLAGQTVQFRFTFDSDGSVTDEGAWIDDLVVESTCAPKPCTSDSNCSAPAGCIDGSCGDNGCIFETDPECCQGPGDCDDGNPCTLDQCVNYECRFGPDPQNPGCCLADADCDDGNPCTEDVCDGGQCARQCTDECPYGYPYADGFDTAVNRDNTCWEAHVRSGTVVNAWQLEHTDPTLNGPHFVFDLADLPVGEFQHCMRSPVIDVSTARTARLGFTHDFDVYSYASGDNVARIRLQVDGGDWMAIWSRSDASDDTSGTLNISVSRHVVGASEARIEFCVDGVGDSYWDDFVWRIDDVRLFGDVAVGEPPVWNDLPGLWEAPIGSETPFVVSGTDPEGEELAITLEDGPEFVFIVDNGDGSANLSAAPMLGDAGEYEVTVTLSDPYYDVEQVVPLTVFVPGEAPVLADPGPQTVIVNTVKKVILSATDADGHPLSYTLVGDVPSFASLQDAGNGSAILTLAPSIYERGSYTVGGLLSDTTQLVPFEIPIEVVLPGETAVFVETFEPDADGEEADLVSMGWEILSDDASLGNDWLLAESGSGYAPLYVDFPPAEGFQDTLASPLFGAANMASVFVRWTNEFRDYGDITAEPPVVISLLVSTDAGANWETVWSHSELDGDLAGVTTDVDVTAQLAGASAARLAFRLEGGSTLALLSWSVDDVIVYGELAPPAEPVE